MTEKTYTEDEAMHLVAREVAKQRMSDMERLIKDNDSKTSLSITELKLKIEQLFVLIEHQSEVRAKASKELKEEIEKDFASKLDLQHLKNKVDQLWLRITLPIGGITAAGLVIQYMIAMAGQVRLG